MKIVANPKLIGSQSKTPSKPGGVFSSIPRSQRPVISDPKELLRRLLGREGPVKDAGEICLEHPDAARWLLVHIQEVDDLRTRFGKAGGRFEAYAAAARQAIGRDVARACLAEMERGDL
jgi:hypothetical protein